MNLSRNELSRRAFSPESRTVWVESQIVGSTVVPIDNFPLGPGEYSPDFTVKRHISTPKLGSRSDISPFLSFRSNLIRENTLIPFSKIRNQNELKQTEPLPLIGHEPILGPFHSSNGVSKSPNIKFSSTLLDRNPTRLALKSYYGNDDGLRKNPKLISLPKDKRFRYPKSQGNFYHKNSLNSIPRELSPEPSNLTWQSSISSNNKDIDNFNNKDFLYEDLSEAKLISSSAAKNLKIKKKIIPVTFESKIRETFDASSYERLRKAAPLDLNPFVINKLSKSKIFNSSFTKLKTYESRPVQSSVADKIKLYI